MKTTEQKLQLNEDSLLRDVLQYFDSKKALGDILGISKQAVSNMDMDAPLSRLHYLTLRHEKRPDLYPVEESAA